MENLLAPYVTGVSPNEMRLTDRAIAIRKRNVLSLLICTYGLAGFLNPITCNFPSAPASRMSTVTDVDVKSSQRNICLRKEFQRVHGLPFWLSPSLRTKENQKRAVGRLCLRMFSPAATPPPPRIRFPKYTRTSCCVLKMCNLNSKQITKDYRFAHPARHVRPPKWAPTSPRSAQMRPSGPRELIEWITSCQPPWWEQTRPRFATEARSILEPVRPSYHTLFVQHETRVVRSEARDSRSTATRDPQPANHAPLPSTRYSLLAIRHWRLAPRLPSSPRLSLMHFQRGSDIACTPTEKTPALPA